ncbi:uncharacterized protein (DUF1697 family) [Bradyrhizobium sp. GM0.4]
MGAFIALLRAVNVGGTGKLPMSELKAMCEELGYAAVRTYIASGNVVFTSRKSQSAIKTALEKRLHAYAGAPVGVLVRSATEMAQVLADNPFPKAAPNRTVAIFLDKAPPADALAGIRGQNKEEIRLGRREIYVHYGDGMGTSKLVIPAANRHRAQHENDRDARENGRRALGQLERRDPRQHQQDPRDLHRAQRLAEQHHTHDDGAGGADAGPDRIGDADLEHLQSTPEQDNEGYEQHERNDAPASARVAFRIFHRDRPANIECACDHQHQPGHGLRHRRGLRPQA